MSFQSVTGSLKGLVSEAHPDFERLASEGEKLAVRAAAKGQEAVDQGRGQERQEELEKELGTGGQIRAKYKIEVIFEANRTTTGPNLCGVMLFESGKHLHGGGDEMMYWCKDNRPDHDEGCWTPISGANLKAGAAFCPSCKHLVSSEFATNMRIFKLPTRTLSGVLEKFFRQLGSNADLYLKYHRTDMRYVAMEKAKGPEVARRLKGMHIYPLKNILRDTMNGADLAGRFYAFLTS